MPMLGDIFAAARDSAHSVEAWLETRDPELMAVISGAATQAGTSPRSFIREAVSDFSRFASGEDWATLTSGVRDARDPGIACLLAMVRWKLAESGMMESGPSDNHVGTGHERQT